MTRQFELILLVEEISPEQEDRIYDEYDALVASHTGSARLTVTVDGESALDGAHRLLGFLRGIGVQVLQFCEDFVTRGDIAERARVSRQAVGLWVRGERQAQTPFPLMYSDVAGGIWLFGEVDGWLRKNLSSYDGPDVCFPTRAEHVALAELLLRTQGNAYRVDVRWEGFTIDQSAVEPGENPGPIDSQKHTWSEVARVQAVDLRLAA